MTRKAISKFKLFRPNNVLYIAFVRTNFIFVVNSGYLPTTQKQQCQN